MESNGYSSQSSEEEFDNNPIESEDDGESVTFHGGYDETSSTAEQNSGSIKGTFSMAECVTDINGKRN
jgi:hypothetical protein